MIISNTFSVDTNLKNKNRLKSAIIAVLILIIGLLPYLFIDTSSTRIGEFLDIFFNFKKISLSTDNLFYKLFTSFFSDFCWAFSVPFILFALSENGYRKAVYIWGTPIIGCILEILQFARILNGTGDIYDILTYFFASVLSYAIVERRFIKCKTKDHPKTPYSQ